MYQLSPVTSANSLSHSPTIHNRLVCQSRNVCLGKPPHLSGKPKISKPQNITYLPMKNRILFFYFIFIVAIYFFLLDLSSPCSSKYRRWGQTNRQTDRHKDRQTDGHRNREYCGRGGGGQTFSRIKRKKTLNYALVLVVKWNNSITKFPYRSSPPS